jgi:predicted PurR-regulated permease PerM
MDKEIVISIKTIAVAFLAILGGYVIYRLGPIFAVLLIAGLLVLSLEPLVKWFMRQSLFGKKVSRSFSVILTYILFILIVIVLFTSILPPVINQVQKLLGSLIALFPNLNVVLGQNISLNSLLPQLSGFTGGLLGILSSGFTVATTLVSLIMISIYMSLDWENLKRRFILLFPDKNKLQILRAVEAIEQNVGNWVKGQIVLMVFIGVLDFGMFVLLGVRYPLALGLLGGLTEIIPILGPVITALIASIIAFVDSPIKGLAVIAGSILSQPAENNILVPKIMQKVSGFSPLAILVALLIGNTFFGVLGAVLAVPFTMVAVIIIKSVLRAGNQ